MDPSPVLGILRWLLSDISVVTYTVLIKSTLQALTSGAAEVQMIKVV